MVVACTWGLEVDTFIAADGTEYVFSPTKARRIMADEGTGMPPIDYITQRGPFQHGESLEDYFLQPRIIQWRIRQNFKSRAAYWEGRRELLDILRPNRGEATNTIVGVLRKQLPDGTKRDIKGTILQGPNFAPRTLEVWQEWTIDEILRFVAHDPVYFDPDQITIIFGQGTDLVFPITFPITFGGFASATFVYDGTWSEFPTFIITGPITGPSITNMTTDENLSLNYAVPAGVTVTINLAYGAKTVVDDLGNNLIGYLTSDSDLATWHLRPGSNTVVASGADASVASAMTMQYYNRYIGI